MTRDTVIINVIDASILPLDTHGDIIEILADVPAIDDIAVAAGKAYISIVVFSGRNDDGRIWKGRNMEEGESRIAVLPHMTNPLIPEGMTYEDLVLCENILFFYSEELLRLEEIFSEDIALLYAEAELYQLIIQYLYAGTDAGDIYN